MTLELHATPEEVMRAVDALQELGQARQVAENTLFGLALALGECASNIVKHALRRDARQRFRVTLEHTGSAMVIELRDRGPEFDPTQAPVKEKDANDDDRPPGGWGIQLVRRYIDEMRYTREGDENVLRLTRRLGVPTGQKQLRSETQSCKPNKTKPCPSKFKSNRTSAARKPEPSP
jgi:anti-sigma regulatory factor (Ser/Thr protein kinase)